jgi:peptide/nickel transport system ATP-binding protein
VSVTETETTPMADDHVMLSVDNLVVEFPAQGGATVHAVSGVSFEIRRGQTLGLVGESGCGKSTTAKAIAQQVRATGGRVVLEGRDLSGLDQDARRKMRTEVQLIFQDPVSSLNPRRVIEDQIGEGLRIWRRGDKQERVARVKEIMEQCGLEYRPEEKRRRNQFSGGQCQRISIARALVLDPRILVCDEPLSALDVSVQAQILNLLLDLREKFGLTMLFITHDLAVVRQISDRVAVMYLGKICEVGKPEELYENPLHHYSAMLLSAIPTTSLLGETDRAHVVPVGEVPSPLDPPSGCRFRTRCPRAEERCAVEEPLLRSVGDRQVACHFPLGAEPAPPPESTVATVGTDGGAS